MNRSSAQGRLPAGTSMIVRRGRRAASPLISQVQFSRPKDEPVVGGGARVRAGTARLRAASGPAHPSRWPTRPLKREKRASPGGRRWFWLHLLHHLRLHAEVRAFSLTFVYCTGPVHRSTGRERLHRNFEWTVVIGTNAVGCSNGEQYLGPWPRSVPARPQNPIRPFVAVCPAEFDPSSVEAV
jgi:hypothetical protein